MKSITAFFNSNATPQIILLLSEVHMLSSVVHTISHSWNDRLLRIAFLAILFMGTAVASVAPFQSVIGIEQLGFSNASYAIIVFMGSVFSVVISVSVGIYCDQTGRYREILLASITMGIFAGLLMWVLPSKLSFLAVHIVLFPLGSTIFTQAFAMANLAARRNKALDRDMSMSIVRAGFAGSFALTPPVWALLMSNGFELLSVYGYVAFIQFVIMMLVLTSWPKKTPTQESEKSGIGFFASVGELANMSIFIRLLLVSTMMGANTLYNILLGLLILNNMGGTEPDVGWFAGGVALLEVPIMLLGAVFLRHVNRTQLMLIGMLIYTGFLIGLGTITNMNYAWFLIIPAGIGAGIILSVPLAYIQDLKADRPGAGSSLISITQVVGTVIASTAFASGSAITGYQGVAFIGAAMGFSAALILLLVDMKKPQGVTVK
jgi:SET family sugar efflux transporter-like MFS transporter